LPREFSQYLRIANGSLTETSNHVLDGYDRGYSTQAEIELLLILARRPSAAVTRPLRYLRTVPPMGPSPPTRTVIRNSAEPLNPRTANPRTPNLRTHEPCRPYSTFRRMKHFR
jgi:hypothetical protein